MTFEANSRYLDNDNVYPPTPPPLSVLCASVTKLKTLMNNNEKGEGVQMSMNSFFFVNQDVFFTKKSFFTDSVSTILQLVVARCMLFSRSSLIPQYACILILASPPLKFSFMRVVQYTQNESIRLR